MINWLRKHARAAGLRGFILTAVSGLIIGGAVIVGGPPAANEVSNQVAPQPGLSKALKASISDDLSAGCYVGTEYQALAPTCPDRLASGPSVGAAANSTFARPMTYLANRGIKYEWNPTDHWSGRGINPIQAIVVHVTGGGTCDGIAGWFKNNTVDVNSRVSAHFTVCPDKVVQQVEIGDVAWHAGIWGAKQNLDDPIIKTWWLSNTNPNTRTVGVETLLADGQQLDNFPSMRKNLVELLAYLSTTLGIDPDRNHIIGHFEIDGVNRAVDPRCCMNLDTIVAEVAAKVHGGGTGAEGGPTASAGFTRWVGEANPAFFHNLQVAGTQEVYSRYDFNLPADVDHIQVEFFISSGAFTVLDGTDPNARACFISAGVGRCDVLLDSGPEGKFTLLGVGTIDKLVIVGAYR